VKRRRASASAFFYGAVRIKTSFRWRHRFLLLSKDDRAARLNGIAEADEMYVRESS
jgi:hypothetical protein